MYLEEIILEISVPVLMVNRTESHGKNLMSYKILTKNIAKIIIVLMLLNRINMMLNVVHHYDFGEIKDWLIL